MQSRIRCLPLLLLPLLAAACAPAVSSSAAAPATDLITARRDGNRAVVVTAARPVYAYVLEMRPDRENVLQLLNGGAATELAPGRQLLELEPAVPGTRIRNVRYTGYDRRYCERGERLVFSSGTGPFAGAQSTMRPVNVRGDRRYCLRENLPPSVATVHNLQALVVLASVEPIAPAALGEVIADLNARFVSAARGTNAIFAMTKDALRERGIEAYTVRAR